MWLSSRSASILGAARSTFRPVQDDLKCPSILHPLRPRRPRAEPTTRGSTVAKEPPHIHVEKGDAACKFWLQPIALSRNEGFKHLQNANPAQRVKWRLTGRGLGIHWEEIDEDLSVENLLFAAAKSDQVSNIGR